MHKTVGFSSEEMTLTLNGVLTIRSPLSISPAQHQQVHTSQLTPGHMDRARRVSKLKSITFFGCKSENKPLSNCV